MPRARRPEAEQLPRSEKLYVLTRADLSPGMQAAQAVRAAFQFAVDHTELTARWVLDSNFLVLLSVLDEDALLDLADRVARAGVMNTLVREPDLADQATALAVAPSPVGRLFANLPLLGRDLRPVPEPAVGSRGGRRTG